MSGVTHIARAWDTLMVSLGYLRYGAQGGDWGSAVSGALGEVAPERVAGVHLNLGSVAAGTFDDPTPAELANLEAEKEFQRTGRGYSAIQASRPQTLGYGHPEDAVTRQQILDEISVFANFRDKVTAPTGREAELRFTDLRWFEELPRGGHFAALEQPKSLVGQVRGFFRLFR